MIEIDEFPYLVSSDPSVFSIAGKFVPFTFSKIGQWWEKDTEIDLVAMDNQRKIFFGEIRWKDNVDGVSIEKKLVEKAEEVKWHNEERQEYFAIFAKSFKRRPKEALAFDLKDIEKKLKVKR